jgi:hypothetical protein
VPSGSSSGVAWQVDIPGLSGLVMRLGAEGLKKLQLSGVDIHTIGCMLALGEMTPASVNFRTRLQKIRRSQRAETWWIHDIVQFGSGVNFVVDELLKTRAGENVLALLTTIISILEESAIDVLSGLYESLKTSMANTPSIGNIRATCLPLARKMDFKDRLAELHVWLFHQTKPSSTSWCDITEAVPDCPTIVNLVRTLRDIAMQDADSRPKLAFYGIEGAAWLILYAGDILGLSVCLVYNDGRTHPVSGEFGSAHVLLFPEASGTADVFKHVDRPSDILTLTCEGGHFSNSRNWLLSCDEGGCDFFALICGWNMKDRREIGDLIYSIASEYLEQRLGPVNRVGDTQKTLQRILHLLGLPETSVLKPNWRAENFQRRQGREERRFHLELSLFSSMLQHVDVEPYDRCRHSKLQPQELGGTPSICVRCHLFDVIREVAYFSTSLVFTD